MKSSKYDLENIGVVYVVQKLLFLDEEININANWAEGRKSIRAASDDLWALLKALSEVNELFLVPTFSVENQNI